MESKRYFLYYDQNYRELSGYERTVVLSLGHKALEYHSQFRLKQEREH